MRKKLPILLLICLCITAFALFGCVDNVFTIDRIAVDIPCRLTYQVGESLDVEGGMLKVFYSNGQTEYISFADERVSFSELKREEPGEQIITVRFGNQSTSLSVTVVRQLTEMVIESVPTKVTYRQGEKLNLAGLTVNATFEGGFSMQLRQDSLIVTGFDSSRIGNQTLIVKMKGDTSDISVSFDVTVEEKTINGFSYDKFPSKRNYAVGSALDLTDAVMRIEYSSGVPNYAELVLVDGKYYLKDVKTGELFSDEVEVYSTYQKVTEKGFNGNKKGDHEISLKYNGKTAFGYSLRVLEKVINGYTVQNQAKISKFTPEDKFVDLFMQDLILRLTYSDDDVREYRFPDAYQSKEVNITGYDPASNESTQTLTFDLGIYGIQEITFEMKEPVETHIELTDSGVYELTNGAFLFYTADILTVKDWVFTLYRDNGTQMQFNASNLSVQTNAPATEFSSIEQTFRFKKEAIYTVTVSYHNIVETTFELNVKNKELKELILESEPSKREYIVGETVDLNGLKLIATYQEAGLADGAEVRRRNVSIFPTEAGLKFVYDNTVANNAAVVTVTLTENGTVKTVTFTVTFSAVVESIAIKDTSNAKTKYVLGETFNPNHLVVTIRFIGEADKDVVLQESNDAAWSFSPNSFLELGTRSAIVSYMGKTASFEVSVTNDIETFRILHGDDVFSENQNLGSITQGLPLTLIGYRLQTVRQNGETDEMFLPSQYVTINADNTPDVVTVPTLEIIISCGGHQAVFYMTRNARSHAYYQLNGQWKTLQTSQNGFDPTGLKLMEYFDNGTVNELILGSDYTFYHDTITVPAGSDRVRADVSIRIGGNDISFRRNSGDTDVNYLSVVFFSRIAIHMEFLTRVDILVDEGSTLQDVKAAFALSGMIFNVTFIEGSSELKEEVSIKNADGTFNEDFKILGYKENVSSMHSIRIIYTIGEEDATFVDYTLNINPKELYSIAFASDSYLIGQVGTTVKNTVVEFTDLDYSHAYLDVVFQYKYADGTNKVLPSVRVMVQKSWSDFTKDKAQGTEGTQIQVNITYTYKGKTETSMHLQTTVTLKGKTVVGIEFSKSPKSSYIEGEDFTFNAMDGVPARIRVNYSNGTYEEDNLTQENISAGKIVINSNTLLELFAKFDTYDKVELTDSEEVICTLELTYKGKVLKHQMIIKDRPYVRFEYDVTGTQNKRYGDPVSVLLSVTHNGQAVADGARRYYFVDVEGREFAPVGSGFMMGQNTFAYLPAGNYTVRAVYDGLLLKYNTQEEYSRSFTVAVKDLILSYDTFDHITYGEQIPNFLSKLGSSNFATGEDVSDLIGTLSYVATLNGMMVDVPKGAGAYLLSVNPNITSGNYNIIVPGALGTPYGQFTILKRDVYVKPIAQNVVYGDRISQIRYDAYSDDAFSVALEDSYATQLSGAPVGLNNGLTDAGLPVSRPNAGRYLIIKGGMSDENPNFNIHFWNEEVYLTIERANLTATFAGGQSVYGTAVDSAYFVSRLNISGWKAEDEGRVGFDVKFQIDGVGAYLFGHDLILALKNAKSYLLLPGEMQFANYTVGTFTGNTFVVEKKDAYITAEDATKEYGTADPDNFVYTVTGLEQGDSLSGKPQREPGENVTAADGTLARYLISVGTLNNDNYNLRLSDVKGYLTITPKELLLNIASEDLKKYYDGAAPAISKFTLTGLNNQTLDKLGYIQGTAPNTSLIRLFFDTNSPNRTPNPLRVRLQNNDKNHNISLKEQYTYQIEQLPVPIKWLGEGFTLSAGGAYPYKYNAPYVFTAEADLEGLTLANSSAENVQLRFDRRFDGYLMGNTGKYGVINTGSYNITVEGAVNSNFRLLTSSSAQSTISISFEIIPNTVYLQLDVAVRSKAFDGNKASINKQSTQMFNLFEDGRDPSGAADKNHKVQITDQQQIANILRVSNFTVGSGDTSNVNPNGYPISVNIDPGDPMLGKNIKLEMYNAESSVFYVNPLKITASISKDQQKVTKAYDGKAPFIDYTALTSSSSGLLSTKMLESMLGYIPIGDKIEKMGDAGVYKVVINTESASKNFEIILAEPDYEYTIYQKNILLTFRSGLGYYTGEHQFAVNSSDVIVRDNNLGQGDNWETVFGVLSFQYLYQDSGALAMDNTNGQKGNVGRYAVTLDFNDKKSQHKNYTFEWFGTTTFTVVPAEVSVLPKNTTMIYGENETNAPYRTEYDVRFDRGSDGSVGLVGSAFKQLVKDVFRLNRANPDRVTVGKYDVAFDAAWIAASSDGIHAQFPNYKVSISSIDSRQRFEITKKRVTVQIDDVHKIYGDTIDTASQIRIFFPKWEQEKAWSDTLTAVLSAYNPTLLATDGAGTQYFGFNEQYTFRYTGNNIMGNNPVVPTALATREPKAEGGVHGYKIELMRLFGADNYEFHYAEGNPGTAYVDPKVLDVTFDDMQWVYLDAWKTDGADESFDNFASALKISGFIDGMGDVLKYPVLLKGGNFGSVLDKLTKSGVAGETFAVQSDWFDAAASDVVNPNYQFNFSAIDGSRRIEIKKATLYAVIKTADNQSELSLPYGQLPTAEQLKIVYTGLRGADTVDALLAKASLPNFVENYDSTTRIAKLLNYKPDGHLIRPDSSTFVAANYELNVDASDIPDPFLFKVGKAPLSVRSMAVGTPTELNTFWGTPLVKGTHYEVEFAGFINEVTLTGSGVTAVVEDNENTVFYNVSPSTEWVSYNTNVNVVKNVANNPTPILPNIAAMNDIGNNYSVSAESGADLKVHIYNKVKNIETAVKSTTIGNQYGYVIERAANANQLRIKLNYINGETHYINLPMTASTFTVEELFGTFSIQGYQLLEKGNQNVEVTYQELNTLVGGTDSKTTHIMVRNIGASDSFIANGDLSISSLVGSSVDATASKATYTVSGVGGSVTEEKAKNFDMVKLSFVLLRGASSSGTFDLIVDNLNGYRYILRLSMGTANSGTQRLMVIEQTRQSDGTYVDSNTQYYSIGSIDMLDAKSHNYQLYLNKLTNTLVLVVDNAFIISHQIVVGTLGIENRLSIEFDKVYAYVTDFTMGKQGYPEEDAVRLVANNKETVLTLDEGEPFRNITPSSMFGFWWNYAHDFYRTPDTAPVVRYYLNGSELTSDQLSLSAGNHTLTAKVFRGDNMQVPIASASIYIAVADGYYQDNLIKTDADGNVSTYYPTANNPAGITNVPSGGEVFMGTVDANFTHYSISFSDLRFGQDQGDTGATIDFNIKSNAPATSAFNAATTDLNYIGLTLRIEKIGTNVITKLRLVSGDGETTFRKELTASPAIDWTRKNGVYTINATMDKSNLFVSVDILFNGVKTYNFLFDGKESSQNYGETISTKPSDIGYVTENEDIKHYAPISYAIQKLTNSRMQHSIIMKNIVEMQISELVINTHAELLTNYIRRLASTDTSATSLKPHVDGNGLSDIVTGGQEIQYMITDNGFAAGAESNLLATANRYETYGARFKAQSAGTGTSKLRLILAENAPKTNAERNNQYTVRASRNISLTFMRQSGISRLYVSWNDSQLNSSIDNFGEPDKRYEQLIYSFGDTVGEGQIDFFDGKEHTVVVGFDRQEVNIENSLGLTNAPSYTGNRLYVYVDGKAVGGTFYYPMYNNGNSWRYQLTNNDTWQDALDVATQAPYYDRYFLNERTYSGLSFRGLNLTLYDLAVSEHSKHWTFLNR